MQKDRMDKVHRSTHRGAELGPLLTNCNPLLIQNYMTAFVVSYVIHYITHM